MGAAARRSTSFSCFTNWVRRRASGNTTLSAAVEPGLESSSTSAALSQPIRYDPLIPKSAATCLSWLLGSRLRASFHHVVPELLGMGLGRVTILPAAPLGTTE